MENVIEYHRLTFAKRNFTIVKIKAGITFLIKQTGFFYVTYCK